MLNHRIGEIYVFGRFFKGHLNWKIALQVNARPCLTRSKTPKVFRIFDFSLTKKDQIIAGEQKRNVVDRLRTPATMFGLA